MEKDENIVKEAEEEAKRIHDLETANAAVAPATVNAPKNSGSGKNLLIAVLIVLLLVAVCVILFVTGVFGGKSKNDNKNNGKENVVENKENTENTNTENTNTENVEKPVDTPTYKEEKLTVDSEEVQKLFQAFYGVITFGGEGTDDYSIKISAAKQLLNQDDLETKTCGDLNNYEYNGYYCAVGDIEALRDPSTREITAEGVEKIKSSEIKTISVDKFNETYKKLFGTLPTEQPKSVPLLECLGLLYYDEVNKLYAIGFIYPNAGCEGALSLKLDSITQENGKLVLHIIGTDPGDEVIKNTDLTFKFDETTGNYIYESLINN